MRLSSQPSHARAAFTLIELLVVLLIIAVLSALVLRASRVVRDRAKVGQARVDMQALLVALELYKKENGRYPTIPTVAHSGGSWSYNSEHAVLLDALLGTWPPALDPYYGKRKKYVEWPPERINPQNGQTNAVNRYHNIETEAGFLDPWGGRYGYRVEGVDQYGGMSSVLRDQEVYITSLGPDGLTNTDDDLNSKNPSKGF